MKQDNIKKLSKILLIIETILLFTWINSIIFSNNYILSVIMVVNYLTICISYVILFKKNKYDSSNSEIEIILNKVVKTKYILFVSVELIGFIISIFVKNELIYYVDCIIVFIVFYFSMFIWYRVCKKIEKKEVKKNIILIVIASLIILLFPLIHYLIVGFNCNFFDNIMLEVITFEIVRKVNSIYCIYNIFYKKI